MFIIKKIKGKKSHDTVPVRTRDNDLHPYQRSKIISDDPDPIKQKKNLCILNNRQVIYLPLLTKMTYTHLKPVAILV
jgi:hypothetical protein